MGIEPINPEGEHLKCSDVSNCLDCLLIEEIQIGLVIYCNASIHYNIANGVVYKWLFQLLFHRINNCSNEKQEHPECGNDANDIRPQHALARHHALNRID